MNELLIKNIIANILFENKICESIENQYVVDYLYENLQLERLLYGEPVTVPELRKILRNKILNFEFIKLDGEVRPAKGTTMMKYIPQTAHPKGIRPSSPKVATFYDLDKQDWRSVSQRSKEIVLKKDDMTGKPVIMVKDKPEGKEIPAGTEKEINLGDVFQFTKSANIDYKSGVRKKHWVQTWITITEDSEKGFWGITAGSKIPILLTPERLERLGEPMEVGDEYQFTKIGKNSERIFTTINITRKSPEGFWGKTEGSQKEILLTNERLLRVHKYEQPDITMDGEPLTVGPKVDPDPETPDLEVEPPEEKPEEEPEKIKPPVSKVKPVETTEIEKEYHFKNPATGATETETMTPKKVIKKLKELGSDWVLQTPDEYDTDQETVSKLAQSDIPEVPDKPEIELPEEPEFKPIIKKGEDLGNIDANEL